MPWTHWTWTSARISSTQNSTFIRCILLSRICLDKLSDHLKWEAILVMKDLLAENKLCPNFTQSVLAKVPVPTVCNVLCESGRWTSESKGTTFVLVFPSESKLDTSERCSSYVSHVIINWIGCMPRILKFMQNEKPTGLYRRRGRRFRKHIIW